MVDKFSQSDPAIIAPYRAAFDILSQDVDLSQVTRAVYVGSTGDLSVEMADWAENTATIIFYGVPAGTILPIRITRVNSVGTTAGSVVGLV